MGKSKKGRVLTAFIGAQDIYEWVTSEDGRATMFPILMSGVEKTIEEDLEEHHVLRVESLVNYNMQKFNFYVKKEDLSDTLEKIMEWALEEEEYEICARVKKVEEKLVKEEF